MRQGLELGLEGKTAVVTGGASNIGHAVSLGFAEQGANVVVVDIDEKNMAKVIEIANGMKSGARAVAIKTDVTKYEEVKAVVEKVVKDFGSIDVLVNCVGKSSPQLFVEDTPESWQKTIAINYVSCLNCMRLVVPHMIEQRKGAIVNISSDAGRMGEYREVVYSGSKGGVIASTKSLAREVGRYGIRVNAICPSMTRPAPDEIGEYSMFKDKAPLTEERREKILKNYPLRKLGKPQDVASTVLFFASEIAAGNITGQTLSVNGGYYMG